ncbi:hypothetical protein C8J57DRAFT_1244342 [Mycena rebaudengoi]|nr:hypothetical protein C8J57DRAFT_1244342 [Mycena rebaudengoi]
MDNSESPSQLLSFALIALTTFIPNDSLRYIVLASTLLSLGGYTVFANNLSSQAARCETVMKEIEALFVTVTKECARDLRFITEAGLQLTFNITWRAYPLHLRLVLLSITECRRNFGELRSSMQLAFQVALEHARQQAYIEDINQKRRTLEVVFAEGFPFETEVISSGEFPFFLNLSWYQCMKFAVFGEKLESGKNHRNCAFQAAQIENRIVVHRPIDVKPSL